MAGEIISAIAQATTHSSWVDAPALRSVSESDAARMSDLLSSGNQPVQAPAEVAQPTPGGNSIGDAILRSMDAVGRNYKAKAMEVDRMFAVDGGRMSVTDLVRVQFNLIDTSIQVDLFSKLVSKGTQHIDQLTKLQ